MDAYSEDLRKKIVEAVERREMKKSEVARQFGMSLSSVKRYVRKFRQGSSLSPGKAPGKHPKVDEHARRLLEADLKERPFAKLRQRCDYLEALAGLRVSRSTLCRALKQMGFSRKKGSGCQRARRMVQSRLEGNRRRNARPKAFGVRGRMWHSCLARTHLRLPS